MTHAHNSPNLSAHEFLLAIVHDPSVDLDQRMDAAGKLLSAGLGDIGTVSTILISLTGGIPANPIGADRPPGIVTDVSTTTRPPRHRRGFYLVKSG